MSNIALSNGVRQNLLSLQQTSRQQTEIQQRLATGKRVNSAIDNPVNFFTSGSLYDRASQLSALLDGQSNAVQTVQAASKGIDGITKLVQSAQSTIKQAQNEAAQNRPSKTGDANILATANEASVTGKSLRDVALDKKLEGAVAAASSTTNGNLGIAASSDVVISAGNTTYKFATTSSMTVRDLVNEVNKSGIASASVDSAGKLSISGTGSDTLTFNVSKTTGSPAVTTSYNANLFTATGSTSTTAADLAAGVTGGASSAVRTNLIQQFNDLRTQINQLAKDAGYNGTNLLDGNKLSVVFNEKTGQSQTKLDIQGQTVSSDNLGIGTAVDGTAGTSQFNIQNDGDLGKAADALTGALSSLRSLASTFGANLSVVQTRQDFTKSLIDTLKIGADHLVLADSNEEGANLLALNTRQQLSQTALSLANQADQGVLRLFG